MYLPQSWKSSYCFSTSPLYHRGVRVSENGVTQLCLECARAHILKLQSLVQLQGGGTFTRCDLAGNISVMEGEHLKVTVAPWTLPPPFHLPSKKRLVLLYHEPLPQAPDNRTHWPWKEASKVRTEINLASLSVRDLKYLLQYLRDD